MKHSDFKQIVKDSMREAFYIKKAKIPLNEALYGKKVELQYDNDYYNAVISKNTKPNELPYRITWFGAIGTPYVNAKGHIDITEEEANYIIDNSKFPQSFYDRYSFYNPENLKISQVYENLLLEELFGQRLYLIIKDQFGNDLKIHGLISKNTIHHRVFSTGYKEQEYRFTWFNRDITIPKGHIDFSKNAVNYILTKKKLPLKLKKLFSDKFLCSIKDISVEFVDKFDETTIFSHNELLLLENSSREIDLWLENKTLINESMTLSIKGANYGYNLNELTGICDKLQSVVLSPVLTKLPQDQQDYFRKNGVGFYETIVPDGSYFVPEPQGSGGYGGIGIINVYLSGFTTNTMREIVRLIFNNLRQWNIQWKQPKIEQSGVYKISKVLRIPVVSNPNKETNPPELNMTNINSYQIFHNLLQYEGEHSFSMETKELMERIQTILKHDPKWIDSNTIKSNDSDWPEAERDEQDIENPHLDIINKLGISGARTIMGGLDSDDIKFRLQEIWKIAKWAVEHGYKELTVG